jgi:hypothetical protein
MRFTERTIAFFFTSIVLVSFGLQAQVSPSSPSEQGQMINEIEKIMEIHYLQQSKKSPFDVIQVQGPSVFISVWRGLPPDPNAEKIECLGYQWLLTGRGQKLGAGAGEVFRVFPALKEITLELDEVQNELISDGGHGLYKKQPKKKAYLTMTVQRDQLQGAKIFRENLKNQKQCLETGRSLVSKREVKL